MGARGRAEVEAIGEADGRGPDAAQVAADLGDRHGAARVGIELAEPAVAVDREGEELVDARLAALAGHAHHGRVGAGADHRAAAHDVIILPIDPLARAEVRRAHQPEELGAEVGRMRDGLRIEGEARGERRVVALGAIVFRRLVGEEVDR